MHPLAVPGPVSRYVVDTGVVCSNLRQTLIRGQPRRSLKHSGGRLSKLALTAFQVERLPST